MTKEGCIFCMIANGEIPSDTVYEDERVRAILDLNPASEGHTLVITKDHFDNVYGLPPETLSAVFGAAARIALAQKKALNAAGINIVQNNEEAAGQTVAHLHVHIIPRYEGGERILTWTQHGSEPERRKELSELIKDNL